MSLKKLSFIETEYRNRLSQVQTRMVEQGLDAILCHSLSNICYLTGYESLYLPKYYMALVPRQGDPILLCQDFEMHNACITAWTSRRMTYKIGEDPIEATIKLLQNQEYGHARLGIEVNAPALSVFAFLRLKDALPEVTWSDGAAVISEVKVIKSPAEIDLIRQASKISSEAMAAALTEAAEGKTDNDLAAVAAFTALKKGSEYMCIDPIITVGQRSGVPHTTHRRKILQTGDCAFMEIGACIHRYSGVIMRTACVGQASDTVKRMAEGCIRSLDAMIEQIKPGKLASDVATCAQTALGPEGKEFLWHGFYGYSIGIGFPPDWADVDFCIREENHQPLRPGMVFHCNTSLRDVCKIGVALSETVLVTDHGCEVLTTLSRELFITE
jgi:Xaa-Pro dipeptidase